MKNLKKILLILSLATALVSCRKSQPIGVELIDSFCRDYAPVDFLTMTNQAHSQWLADTNRLKLMSNFRFDNVKDEYMFYILDSVSKNELLYFDKKCDKYDEIY